MCGYRLASVKYPPAGRFPAFKAGTVEGRVPDLSLEGAHVGRAFLRRMGGRTRQTSRPTDDHHHEANTSADRELHWCPPGNPHISAAALSQGDMKEHPFSGSVASSGWTGLSGLTVL